MKCLRIVMAILVLFLMFTGAAAFAAGMTCSCDTKYPIILAHGTGGAEKILGLVDYWWGIPEALEKNGAEVYVPTVNGMDGTIDKAVAFKARFLEIKAVSGASKFNIIGHSHGALYTRYAITNLGLSPFVQSYTSIAGPHKGMALADLLVSKTPSSIQQSVSEKLNFIFACFFGDTDPDSLANAYDVTRGYMRDVFNPGTPDMPDIYYQSWAAKVRYACPNKVLEPTWLLLLPQEGENDGLVSVESAKWGEFQGAEAGTWWSPGCDHLAVIGHLFGVTPGFNAPDFYVDIVSGLKDKGF